MYLVLRDTLSTSWPSTHYNLRTPCTCSQLIICVASMSSRSSVPCDPFAMTSWSCCMHRIETRLCESYHDASKSLTLRSKLLMLFDVGVNYQTSVLMTNRCDPPQRTTSLTILWACVAVPDLIDVWGFWYPLGSHVCCTHVECWNALMAQSSAQDFGWSPPRDPPEESLVLKTAWFPILKI